MQPSDGAPSVRPRRGLFVDFERLRLFTIDFLVLCLDLARFTLQKAPTARPSPQTMMKRRSGTHDTPALPTRILPRADHPILGVVGGGQVLVVQKRTMGHRAIGVALDQR